MSEPAGTTSRSLWWTWRAMPLGPRIVTGILIGFGAVYALVGFGAFLSAKGSDAVLGALVMLIGVAGALIGWRLLLHERWAYRAAIALFALAAVVAIVRFAASLQRQDVALMFWPAVGLWLLLVRESRDFFGSGAAVRRTDGTSR